MPTEKKNSGLKARLGEEGYKLWRRELMLTPEKQQKRLEVAATEEFKKRVGDGLYKSHNKPVIVYGVEYRGVSEAAKALGLSAALVRYRIKAVTPAFRHWNYKEVKCS